MNTTTIDLSRGALPLDPAEIAPKSLDEFRQTISSLGLDIGEIFPNDGFIANGMTGTLLGEN